MDPKNMSLHMIVTMIASQNAGYILTNLIGKKFG